MFFKKILVHSWLGLFQWWLKPASKRKVIQCLTGTKSNILLPFSFKKYTCIMKKCIYLIVHIWMGWEIPVSILKTYRSCFYNNLREDKNRPQQASPLGKATTCPEIQSGLSHTTTWTLSPHRYLPHRDAFLGREKEVTATSVCKNENGRFGWWNALEGKGA